MNLALKKFLFSNKNMIGIGCAMLTVVLALVGVLKSYWLVVMVLSYIFGYLVAPQEQEIKFYHIKGESIKDYLGFITKLTSKVEESEKIPNEAKAVMKDLATNAIELLTFMQNEDSVDEFSEEVTSFKNIFDSYLPKLINQYEKLPVKYAHSVKTSQGKTAKQMLIEQLELMNQKITEISYGMYEHDVTALKVNGRFLKEKFAQNSNIFEVEKELGK